MEKTIDRKEYRRNGEQDKIATEEQIDILQKRIKTFLFQSLGASIVLLTVAFLKCYHCTEILNKIKLSLNEEITISSLKENGQIIFNKATNYYAKLNSFVETMVSQENGIKNNYTLESGDINNTENANNIASSIVNAENSNEKINSENSNNIFNSTTNSGEAIKTYECAVEGINQMSEDASKIKEKYKMTVPVIGTITSRFGVRISDNPNVGHYHSGLDIAANTGTQILAALDGEVIEASTDTYFGKYLKIKKDNIIILYAHCSKLLVKAGDKVQKGKLIAYVGNTGNSTGPHLHFELTYEDRLVNPEDVLDI